MATTRRGLLLAGAGGALAASQPGLSRPAVAQGEPIRFGWLAALTGPGSSAGIGFDRGIRFAAEEVNGAGGVRGRKLDVLTRDTQGDPTKCVNATQEMINRLRAHMVWGPCNSGESLAATPILARGKMPNMHPCVVDQLIDPAKYPNAFRQAPSNQQWAEAAHRYCLQVLKLRDIVVVGDTTGYGTSAAEASERMLKGEGANVVGKYLIEAQQTDVTADMTRMRNAGAKVVLIWSVNGGYLSRIINTRAQMGWDVPIVGHPTLGSGEVKALLARPENWEKVYMVGYRSCSFDAEGKLPPRTADFVRRIAGKITLSDTSLWWVACGYDAVHLAAQAVGETGSTESAKIIEHWNSLRGHPGIFGDYTFTPTEHNGYPGEDVVMSLANSNREGAFTIAPGYG